MNSKGVLCILVFFMHLDCLVGMVYQSILWDPDNPLFKCEECDPAYKYRLLKIQSASKIKFICPNVATVLKSTLNEVSKTNKYENLWYLRNRTSFDACDTSLDPEHRLLLRCVNPTELEFYSVTFQRHSAEPDKELTFKRGQSYFFVATSNRLLSRINDTKDGHCNDANNKIYMKIEVYICNTTADPKCDKDVGKLVCPKTLQPTTSSSTTPTCPPTQPTHSSKASVGQTVTTSTVPVTGNPNEGKTPIEEKTPTEGKTPTEENSTCTCTHKESGNTEKRTGDGGNEEAKKANWWRTVAISFIVLCVVLFIVIVIAAIHFFCGKRKCPYQTRQVEHSSEYGAKNLGFMSEVDGTKTKTSIAEHEYDMPDKDSGISVITHFQGGILYKNTAVAEGKESKENPPV